ncbi:6-phosphogluconolactonase [Marinobacter sp. SS21]|uniref:6-phosphogluconolactonase n=1 Tax=Marinobacter sp. SS21 TaxID=2979460 RepID=UPI0023306838|nr:6-phosphogluconolactonase [Marinobacter sp. SS21]MDC0663494.1 6-phosphogluconolactonase [Marinobacter sp. SS21]
MKTLDINVPEGVDVVTAEDAHTVASMLAEKVAGVLANRLRQPGRASLAVSGGRTPVAFFELLARKPIEWARVDVVLADERWVEETHPASNAALVKRYLIQGPAAAANFLSFWRAGMSPVDASADADQALAAIEWPLTALVLGMGNDGHTASLFPDAPELYQAMDVKRPNHVVTLTPPSQPHARVSLSLRALAGARYKALHLRGMDKAETLKLACDQLDDVAEMPIRVFLRLGLVVYWSA